MATTNKRPMPKKRCTRYSAEYRAEALALADRIGVSAAAKELGIHSTQLYQWWTKATHEASVRDRERSLAEENAWLKRLLAERTEEVKILEKWWCTPSSSSHVAG